MSRKKEIKNAGGRPNKYIESTEVISVRVPQSLHKVMKAAIEDLVDTHCKLFLKK